MTSTNFNVGIVESRNSSRVLKPPGGGHSDIFGIYEVQEQQTPKAKNKQPRSTISEVFGSSEVTATLTKQKSEEEQVEEQVDQVDISNENEAPPKPIPTPQRIRVPPGGFSSALW